MLVPSCGIVAPCGEASLVSDIDGPSLGTGLACRIHQEDSPVPSKAKEIGGPHRRPGDLWRQE
jgi:hypothetical protein